MGIGLRLRTSSGGRPTRATGRELEPEPGSATFGFLADPPSARKREEKNKSGGKPGVGAARNWRI